VLLQASNARKHEVVNEIARQFGASADHSEQLRAKVLFQPNEAMLSPAGEQALRAIAAARLKSGEGIEIHSIGQDAAAMRYDGWDLAAARLGAVARALNHYGIAQSKISIKGLDTGQKGQGEQAFTLVFIAGNIPR
jgi:outer membrane protein OmpA-like peptidoglycan-associated protein